ncbi:MAG: transposase [Desulfuromonadales bacterium]|nr:transposase [Desulfuromonadales bacterium]
MARKLRIHFAGAVYHVILRGNAGDPVFFADRDRYRLYLILQFAAATFGCRFHAFCLMTNHIHLVMQVGEMPLSRIMQNISLRYTKWINTTQGRTGHVFQGRYKALLIDADPYLLELVRYVHLNPVRAGIVTSVNDWPWTGHRAYLGIETLPWLTTEVVLSMLAPTTGKARAAYDAFIADGLGEGRRDDFHSGTCEGRLLGDDDFVDAALGKANQWRQTATVADILAAVSRMYGKSLEELQAPGKSRPYTEARAMASLLVQEMPHLSLTELAKTLHRDIAPLGRVGRRLRDQGMKDEHISRQVERLRKELLKQQKG